ncbi:MAG: tetratricopeptide repeat protein [Alphaproteobacteria bacterium]|nr:tetratricopeptide repeat protein [Alphaproteobacteria bacterium]
MLSLFTGPALAQQVAQNQIEQRVEDAQGENPGITAAQRAARAAIDAMNDPNCPTVTFADILSNPDDSALNVCYARGQIQSGNVKGALATLERVLLIAPEALNVRLLYAIILYRLDNMAEAEREFQTVAQADLPPEVRNQVDTYLNDIQQQQKTTKQSVKVSVGVYADSNRNAAPVSESLTAFGARSPIALERDRPNGALGLLTILGYDFTHDPGLQNQHEIFGGVDLYGDTLSEQNKLDIQALNMDLGFRWRYPGVTIAPRVFLSNMRLGWDKFYNSKGVELRVDHKIRLPDPGMAPLDSWFLVSGQQENYHNTPEFQTLTLRSGRKSDAEIGVGTLLFPEHYVSLVAREQYKSGASDPGNSGAKTFSYKYHSVEANHTWILENGKFLVSTIGLGTRQYKQPDPLVQSGVHRLEQPFLMRMTYGMPLSELIGTNWLKERRAETPDFLYFAEDTTISLTGEYRYQRSNITNYQTENKRIQLMLTRSFDF